MNSKNIIIYTKPKSGNPKERCMNCEILEGFLILNGIEYQRVHMSTPAAMTEIAMYRVIPMYTPVMQIDDNIYYREMWKEHGRILDMEKIKELIDDRKDWKDVRSVEGECKDGVCKIN